MVTNADGWVGIKYLQSVQQYITVNGREYVLTTRNNVTMSWVHPDDVDAILSIVKECCGGQKHKKFTLSNELDVQRWTA